MDKFDININEVLCPEKTKGNDEACIEWQFALANQNGAVQLGFSWKLDILKWW